MAKKSAKKGNASAGDFLVRSRVKEAIAKAKCQSSEDVMAALNSVVAWYLDQGVKRAKANKRKTVRGYDICS